MLNTKKRLFTLFGMHCASCVAGVESVLKNTKGVVNVSVNFSSSTVLIEYQDTTNEFLLKDVLQSVGYELIIDNDISHDETEELKKYNLYKLKNKTILSFVLTVPVFVLGMFFSDWIIGRWVSMVFCLLILFWIGRNFFYNAWNLAKIGVANMDTLVVLNTTFTFFFSVFNTFFSEFWYKSNITPHVYFDSVGVIISFILLGKLLEEKAKNNTSSAIKKLIGLQPKTVNIIHNGLEIEIPISDVQLGYQILLKPGMKIPVDGELTKGNSFVDESMINGEPIPNEKNIGSKVFAGTINQNGYFEMIAKKIGKDTLLSQIIKMVQEAQNTKIPIQKLVDKIAGYFVPFVMIVALITFLTWFFLEDQNAFSHAFVTSVAVLVVACPCALGLATPTAIMVGIGKGAENNMLIKEADCLELGHKTNAIVLDKTGTITIGKPTISDWFWDDKNDYYKGILLALESKSEHPLAQGVVDRLSKEKYEIEGIKDFKNLPGMGVGAVSLIDCEKYFVGNERLLKQNNIQLSSSLLTHSNRWRSEGKTVIFFANQHRVIAIISFWDELKKNACKAIENLLKRGIEVYMLTGDNEQTAKCVADKIGIKNFKAEVLPSEKADFIKKLQLKGKVVAMVGDGVNDANALAQADVSIALGNGSDIAMDVAHMTITTPDLLAIPKAFKLSSSIVYGIRQNLFWAFVYNIIAIPIAAGVLYSYNGLIIDPMIAGILMAFSSFSVVLNSLRLKLIKI